MGKRLRQALRAAGFAITHDPQRADCIITHSGGALLVPADARAKAVLVVAPPVAYQGAIAINTHRKIFLDQHYYWRKRMFMRWLIKTGWNTAYLLTGLRAAAQMLRRIERHALPPLPDTSVAIIAFRSDPWSQGIGPAGLHLKHSYTFVSYDRIHDDLWLHPEDYISVLQYLYAS